VHIAQTHSRLCGPLGPFLALAALAAGYQCPEYASSARHDIHSGRCRENTLDGSPKDYCRWRARRSATCASLQGVNGKRRPPGSHKPENFTFGGWEHAGAHRCLGRLPHGPKSTSSATHDAYGPADIDAEIRDRGMRREAGLNLRARPRCVRPSFPDPTADPNDPPQPITFGPTDHLIALHPQKWGAQGDVRLGRQVKAADAQPPRDFDKIRGPIARHIVLHYNRGWAKGFPLRKSVSGRSGNEGPDLGKVVLGRHRASVFRVVRQSSPGRCESG